LRIAKICANKRFSENRNLVEKLPKFNALNRTSEKGVSLAHAGFLRQHTATQPCVGPAGGVRKTCVQGSLAHLKPPSQRTNDLWVHGWQFGADSLID
jgi:hypothetical protein